jgi:hypothetical protein
LLKKYYDDIASNEARCITEAFNSNAVAISNAHQKISDLSKLFRLASKQAEGFVYNSLLYDLGIALYHGVTGLYRQSYASQRIVLENSIGAIYYSAQPLQLRKWANGMIDISWKRVASGDGGVFTAQYAEAFMPEAMSDCESYSERGNKLYSRLSDFVHKNVKVYDFDNVSFMYDADRLAETLNTFDELVQVITFPFCIRYLQSLDRADLEKVSPAIDALAGNIKAFQRIIGGQAE